MKKIERASMGGSVPNCLAGDMAGAGRTWEQELIPGVPCRWWGLSYRTIIVASQEPALAGSWSLEWNLKIAPKHSVVRPGQSN